jgi:deferrochelatase/peroxidase EfeB
MGDLPHLTHDDFTTDPEGRRVPRFAHVRKAHPRDLPGDVEVRISVGKPLHE